MVNHELLRCAVVTSLDFAQDLCQIDNHCNEILQDYYQQLMIRERE